MNSSMIFPFLLITLYAQIRLFLDFLTDLTGLKFHSPLCP